MKKIQLLAGALLVASSVFAQKAELTKKHFVQTKKTVKILPTAKSVAIWSDDFSDASTWVIDHDASACDLDWQIGVGLAPSGSYAISTIASTTYDNGCAMVDSDLYGGEEGGSDVEDSWITTANSIDLSSNENIVLKFQTWYKAYSSEKCFVVTSTNNTDWPELTPDFDASSNPNVYELFAGISDMTDNPTEWGVNISPSAGNESQVWVRFHWTGTWGYAWMLDDVTILNQPANDVILNSAWASSYGSSEYGRTPLSQLADSLVLGGDVFNFGYNDQSSVELAIAITDASGSDVINTVVSAESSLLVDSTIFLNSVEAISLTEGVYTLNATATSDSEQDGENFTNNTYSRKFEISRNIYSLDGIDVYDNPSLSTMGTSTEFNGNVLLTRYTILEETTIVGLEIALSSSTNEGGQIFPFLLPESALINDDGTLNQAADVFSGRIAENVDGVVITTWNVDNNIIYTPLEETILAPGTYYACVELYSAGGEDDGLYVLDDETVWQPYYASLYYSTDAQEVYSNGTATAIRLALADYIGLEEANTSLFSVSPNPSNGVFTVTANNADKYTLEVINILGEVVSTKSIEGSINETINISNLNAGVYLVKVSTATTQNVQRVIIK